MTQWQINTMQFFGEPEYQHRCASDLFFNHGFRMTRLLNLNIIGIVLLSDVILSNHRYHFTDRGLLGDNPTRQPVMTEELRITHDMSGRTWCLIC